MRNKYVYEAEVRYYNRVKADTKISSSKDAEVFLRKIWGDMDRLERGYVLYLNNNRILNYSLHSKGGMNSTIFDCRLIFQEALIHGATVIIIAHNHPSDSLTPSQQDIKITKNINDAGKIMDIKLLDHIILTDSGYFSFADEGLLG